MGEPDPHIIDLNIELGECDDIVSTTLPPEDQRSVSLCIFCLPLISHSASRFVFEGLGLLMEELLISNAQKIHGANAFGMKKMSRNMLALQQCVKTIARDSRDTEFERAKQYYALFSQNPAVSLRAKCPSEACNADFILFIGHAEQYSEEAGLHLR